MSSTENKKKKIKKWKTKGGSNGYFVKDNAGDVPYNNAMFNQSFGDFSSGCCGFGEDLETTSNELSIEDALNELKSIEDDDNKLEEDNKYKRMNRALFSDKINESGTSRLRGHLIDRDEWAIVSPYRSERTVLENKAMMTELKAKVRRMGLGFIQFVSRWVEDGESFDEESLLIPNMKLDDAIKLGKEFDQSSIISKSDGVCKEICTKPFEGYSEGDIVRTFNLNGDTPMNIETAERIFSKICGGAASKPKKGGRPFRLSEVYEVLQPRSSYFQEERKLSRVL